MAKRTVHAGKTVFANGALPAGDQLIIQGGAADGCPGGTVFVTTSLSDAGVISVLGGAASTLASQPGGQGSLLDIVGVLTDSGVIMIRAGAAGPSATAAGQGGKMVVSGTLTIGVAGSVTLQGGTSDGPRYSQTGSPNGGVLTNVGLIENAGTIRLAGGAAGNYHYYSPGVGSELDNSGTLSNTGTILIQGGQSGYYFGGSGADLIDSGVMTNAGLIMLGGGPSAGDAATVNQGGRLTVSGMLTNTGTIGVNGGGAGFESYNPGSGGLLLDQGTIANFGTIEVKAGVASPATQNGFGGQAMDSGVLTNTGLIQIDGSSEAFYTTVSGGTMTVSGYLDSQGQIQISGGGGSNPFRDEYFGGKGGVLVDSGYIEVLEGSAFVGGGQASAATQGVGGYGGTLSIALAGDFTVDGDSSVTIGGGAGAAVAGDFAGGQGGMVDLAGLMTIHGPLTLGSGSAGQAGGVDGSGASMIISGLLLNLGIFTIEGDASATLAATAAGGITSTGTIENYVSIVLQGGASLDTFSAGTIQNQGTISGSGTISSLAILNQSVIDAGAGQLVLNGDTVTSTGDPGMLKAGLGGTLTISGGSIDAGQTAVLAGPGATLALTAGNVGVLVKSAAGGTLDLVGGGSAALNAADTNLSVVLSSATNLRLSRMGAIAVTGSSSADTLTALAAGQTLTGGLGADLLTSANPTGDTFRDLAAGLNGDTIAGLAGTDTIDVTDFAPGAGLMLGYTQQGSSGKLTLSEGSASTTITLQGQFTTASFTTASDMHGGLLIALHAGAG